jgi:hypothetical protein
MKIIADTKLLPQKRIQHTGLLLLSQKNIWKVNRKKLDVLSYENFYKPLGANNTMYNPLEKVNKKQNSTDRN